MSMASIFFGKVWGLSHPPWLQFISQMAIDCMTILTILVFTYCYFIAGWRVNEEDRKGRSKIKCFLVKLFIFCIGTSVISGSWQKAVPLVHCQSCYWVCRNIPYWPHCVMCYCIIAPCTALRATMNLEYPEW